MRWELHWKISNNHFRLLLIFYDIKYNARNKKHFYKWAVEYYCERIQNERINLNRKYIYILMKAVTAIQRWHIDNHIWNWRIITMIIEIYGIFVVECMSIKKPINLREWVKLTLENLSVNYVVMEMIHKWFNLN